LELDASISKTSGNPKKVRRKSTVRAIGWRKQPYEVWLLNVW